MLEEKKNKKKAVFASTRLLGSRGRKKFLRKLGKEAFCFKSSGGTYVYLCKRGHALNNFLPKKGILSTLKFNTVSFIKNQSFRI